MMAAIRFPAGMSIRACRETVAACRPRLPAALPAALTLTLVVGIAACDPGHPGGYPIQAAYARPGPYAITTGTVKDAAGSVIYDLFYPRHYAALGFKSPIVTWGNGTAGRPAMVSTLLAHLASYGFTVIASTSGWTGSGTQIDDAAHYLAARAYGDTALQCGEHRVAPVVECPLARLDVVVPELDGVQAKHCRCIGFRPRAQKHAGRRAVLSQ